MKRLRAATLLILAVALWVAGSVPADADCVRAQLEVTRWNDSNITILSEHDCIYATSWPVVSDAYNEHEGQMPWPVPNGTPNGYQVGYWLPLP